MSTNSHKTFESLLNASIKSGLLEDVKSTSVHDLLGLAYNEKDDVFKVKFNKNGKTKSFLV